MAAYSMNSTDGDWHPSVKYLLVLLVVELFVFGLLRSLTQHGG